MAITKMGILLVLVIGLLAMVEQSMQMSSNSMVMEAENGLLSPYAIVFSRKTSERTILKSGDFDLRFTEIIAGRVFRIGFLNGSAVVLVNTGKYSVRFFFSWGNCWPNQASRSSPSISSWDYMFFVCKCRVSIANRALSTYPPIRGVLYFGLAGDLIDDYNHQRLGIGSVVIPKSVSFTGIWDWQANDANGGDLVFGDFNQGENLQNALGSLKFKNMTLYTGQNEVSYPFYLETDKEWMTKALQVKKILYPTPIHVGYRASSSDITVKNPAYATFLYKRYQVATADQESATVALVSRSNDKLYTVFLGISNAVLNGSIVTPEAKTEAAGNATSLSRPSSVYFTNLAHI